jgi:DNA-binding response OmpR family regulator
MHRGARILVVDDDPMIGFSVAGTFSDAGFSVIGPVGTQQEALAALRTAGADAAVIDLTLQGSFCRELVNALREKGLPFVILSGHSRDRVALPELQNVPWIEKPCSDTELLDQVRKALQRAFRMPQRKPIINP